MIAFFAFILPILLMGASVIQAAQFVPGDALVKFVSGTEEGETLARAAEASPLDLTALEPVLKGLESGTGLPLRPKQISGGGWLLLSVDMERLREDLKCRLQALHNVEGVSPSEEGARVDFAPGSPQSQALQEKLAGDPMAFEEIVSQLKTHIGLPLRIRTLSSESVLVKIEPEALTLTLVERLKAVPEVQSAQPNYIMTIQ